MQVMYVCMYVCMYVWSPQGSAATLWGHLPQPKPKTLAHDDPPSPPRRSLCLLRAVSVHGTLFRVSLEARHCCSLAKELIAVQRQRVQNLKARDGKNCDFSELGNFTTPTDILRPTCDLEQIYLFYVIFSSSGAPSRYIRVSKDRLG